MPIFAYKFQGFVRYSCLPYAILAPVSNLRGIIPVKSKEETIVFQEVRISQMERGLGALKELLDKPPHDFTTLQIKEAMERYFELSQRLYIEEFRLRLLKREGAH